MEQFFDPQYLFNLQPGSPNLLFWRVLLIASVLLIIVGIVSTFRLRTYKKDALRYRFWFRLSTWGYTGGVVTALLAFFRFQNAYFLSMRIFIFAWTAAIIVWFALIVKYAVRDLPKKLARREADDQYSKYLPKKK